LDWRCNRINHCLRATSESFELSSRNARTQQRDFDEQVHELRDTVGVIKFTLDELRNVQAEKTAKKKMTKMMLHNRLASEIRRFVYLSQVKLLNTWTKLQRFQKKEDPNNPLGEMPPIEKLLIHTDNASGIDIEFLTKLLSVPFDSRFAYSLRWIQNRLNFFNCCGTTLPPPLPEKVLESTIFDDSPPPVFAYKFYDAETCESSCAN